MRVVSDDDIHTEIIEIRRSLCLRRIAFKCELIPPMHGRNDDISLFLCLFHIFFQHLSMCVVQLALLIEKGLCHKGMRILRRNVGIVCISEDGDTDAVLFHDRDLLCAGFIRIQADRQDIVRTQVFKGVHRSLVSSIITVVVGKRQHIEADLRQLFGDRHRRIE